MLKNVVFCLSKKIKQKNKKIIFLLKNYIIFIKNNFILNKSFIYLIFVNFNA